MATPRIKMFGEIMVRSKEMIGAIKKKGLVGVVVEGFIWSDKFGVGGVIGGYGFVLFIWNNNRINLNNIESSVIYLKNKHDMLHTDIRSKGSLLDCESVQASLLLHLSKKSVKPPGLVILPVDEEGEGEEKKEEITPDWSQALTLKKTTEEKITKDGVIGVGISAAAVGALVGVIAVTLFREE